MGDSEALADLRTALESHLRGAFGGVEVDSDNDFVVTKGSAKVFIRPLEQGEFTLVRIWAITNVGVTIDGGLTRFLVTENAALPFGKFILDERGPSVQFGHTLLGDFLNREELEVAVGAVAERADEYDDRIKERFNGRLFTEAPSMAEFVAAVEASTGQAETPTRSPAATPSGSTFVVQALFGFLALLMAIGAAIYAYSVESSVWLSIFVAILTLNLIGRGVADLITDPQKLRRALYFLLFPALATGVLWGTYELWGAWWLSALLGVVGGAVLNVLIAPLLFPHIHREETLDSLQRFARQRRLAGGS